MKLIKSTLFTAMLCLGIAPATFAGTGDMAAGVKVGTLGVGAEVTVGILPALNFRTGYNLYNYDGTASRSDIDYDYKLKLSTLPLLVDLHPIPLSGFRITAGAMINSNKIDATGQAQGSYEIGDVTYTAAQVGTLKGKIDFNSVAPYAGIGWGNAVGAGLPLTFTCDIGIMFQGTPKVSLDATGPIASDPTFQAEVAKEEADIKNDTDGFKYYPVVSLGLAYKF